jgi:hypothetical protein
MLSVVFYFIILPNVTLLSVILLTIVAPIKGTFALKLTTLIIYR